MTDAELKTNLLEFAKDFCKDDFDDGTPAGVKIFIERAFSYYKKDGKTSESLGDYSVSIEVGTTLPGSILVLLSPYRRIGVPG